MDSHWCAPLVAVAVVVVGGGGGGVVLDVCFYVCMCMICQLWLKILDPFVVHIVMSASGARSRQQAGQHDSSGGSLLRFCVVGGTFELLKPQNKPQP